MSENDGPVTEGEGVASVAAGCDWLCMLWTRRLVSNGEQGKLKVWVEQYEEVALKESNINLYFYSSGMQTDTFNNVIYISI